MLGCGSLEELSAQGLDVSQLMMSEEEMEKAKTEV